MVKKETLEELEDKIKSLTRKKYQSIIDINDLDNQIAEISKRIYELSPEYIRIICFQCSGIGYVESDETDNKGRKKKVKCPLCGMDGYIWAKIWRNKNESDLVKSSRVK